MLWLSLLGCGSSCPSTGNDVLFLGDSLLAWNEKSCRSIASNAAASAGLSYTNGAVNGALLYDGDASIGNQVSSGTFDRVVIIGGANDLNARCSCGPCESTLDRLVLADGSEGVMVDLVASWTARGSQVLLLGYYPVPDGAWYGFDKCFDIITELDRRHALIAERMPNVEFFDLGDLLTPESAKGQYAFDRAHPSPKGARLLGEGVADHL